MVIVKMKDKFLFNIVINIKLKKKNVKYVKKVLN